MRVVYAFVIVAVLVGSAFLVVSLSDGDVITGDAIKKGSFKEILSKNAVKKTSSTREPTPSRKTSRSDRRNRESVQLPSTTKETSSKTLASTAETLCGGEPVPPYYDCVDGELVPQCIDSDGGENYFSLGTVTGLSSSTESYSPFIMKPYYETVGFYQYDRCSGNNLKEWTCTEEGYVGLLPTVDCASYGKVCVQGACREPCTNNLDCSGGSLCYFGACQEEIGAFASWMEEKGYSEDIRNVYLTEFERSNLVSSSPDVLKSQFVSLLKSENSPTARNRPTQDIYGARNHLVSLLERFKTEPVFEMTFYNVLATDTGWTNDPYTAAEVADLEFQLEEIYGRPIEITVENISVNYMDTFGSDPSYPVALYPPDPSASYPGAIIFNSRMHYAFLGVEANGLITSTCADNGNYYHFASNTTDTGAYAAFDRDCYGMKGCNVACQYSYSPTRYLSVAHEFGHLFGFYHPGLSSTPYGVVGTDDVMMQPGRIGSAIPGGSHFESVLDDERYPKMHPALSPLMRYVLEPDFGYTDDATFVDEYNEYARYRTPTQVQCGDVNDVRDDDGDGVTNACDVCIGYDDTIDSDGDSVPDGCDQCARTLEDPCDQCSSGGEGEPEWCGQCDSLDPCNQCVEGGEGQPEWCEQCGQDYTGYLLFAGLADYDFDGDDVPFVCDSDEWCVGPEYDRFDSTEEFLDPLDSETATGYRLDGTGPFSVTDSCVSSVLGDLSQVGCYGGVLVNRNYGGLPGPIWMRQHCSDLGYSGGCSNGVCV